MADCNTNINSRVIVFDLLYYCFFFKFCAQIALHNNGLKIVPLY